MFSRTTSHRFVSASLKNSRNLRSRSSSSLSRKVVVSSWNEKNTQNLVRRRFLPSQQFLKPFNVVATNRLLSTTCTVKKSSDDDEAVDQEEWNVNLGRNNDNEWLTGPRDCDWFTGVHPKDCPGKYILL